MGYLLSIILSPSSSIVITKESNVKCKVEFMKIKYLQLSYAAYYVLRT